MLQRRVELQLPASELQAAISGPPPAPEPLRSSYSSIAVLPDPSARSGTVERW